MTIHSMSLTEHDIHAGQLEKIRENLLEAPPEIHKLMNRYAKEVERISYVSSSGNHELRRFVQNMRECILRAGVFTTANTKIFKEEPNARLLQKWLQTNGLDASVRRMITASISLQSPSYSQVESQISVQAQTGQAEWMGAEKILLHDPDSQIQATLQELGCDLDEWYRVNVRLPQKPSELGRVQI